MVKVGDEVEALVVRVDAAEQKVALSMRAVQDREERAAIQRVAQQIGHREGDPGRSPLEGRARAVCAEDDGSAADGSSQQAETRVGDLRNDEE